MRHQNKDKGAVLLMTLLVMSLMATLSVSMIDSLRVHIKRAGHMTDSSQSDWYVKSAESLAANYLDDYLKSLSSRELNDRLTQTEVMRFPIENGLMTLSIRDGGHCISLGNLNNAPGQRLLIGLAESLGWSTADAQRLSAAAADWMDSDNQITPGGAEDYTYLARTPPHRTANTDFASVMEIRALGIIDEAQLQVLRPYLCARASSRAPNININTLSLGHAPLLASVLGGGEHIDVARVLIEDRPDGGYASVEQLIASPALETVDLRNSYLDALSFEPKYIWVEASVRYGKIERTLVSEFAISAGRAQPIYRRLLPEAQRPVIVDTLQDRL